jgi:hypothetical protein
MIKIRIPEGLPITVAYEALTTRYPSYKIEMRYDHLLLESEINHNVINDAKAFIQGVGVGYVTARRNQVSRSDTSLDSGSRWG